MDEIAHVPLVNCPVVFHLSQTHLLEFGLSGVLLGKEMNRMAVATFGLPNRSATLSVDRLGFLKIVLMTDDERERPFDRMMNHGFMPRSGAFIVIRTLARTTWRQFRETETNNWHGILQN
jgi:hypothetical protein